MHVSLGGPSTTLDNFPRLTIARNRNLWRVTRKNRSPWWFSSSREGRFDLDSPHGTCYMTVDPLAAVAEVLGSEFVTRVVPSSFFSARTLWCLKPPGTIRAANMTDSLAYGFGVTAEIGTIVPYDIPQEWARALHSSGYGGVLYQLRHPPSPRPGLALFGQGGERTSYPVKRHQELGPALIRQLKAHYGVEVVPVPSSQELRLL